MMRNLNTVIIIGAALLLAGPVGILCLGAMLVLLYIIGIGR